MSNPKFEALVGQIRSLYGAEGFIPLHAPFFGGNEKAYLAECIDSTFVSSVGPFVDKFEEMMKEITGASYAIACMNGTAALHMSLILAGVEPGDEVLTQALTFVATCNALSYQMAHPVFIDVERQSMGMCPVALQNFLETHCEIRDAQVWNRSSGRRIAAVVPMHTFGHPLQIEALARICKEWGLALVEDAAESLGSYVGDRHTGTFGQLGAFSFNGNKTVTAGGGGCIVTNDPELARRAKHLTTTAKLPHPYEFVHDEVGYNYRLPNVNAALACAQLEQLPMILANKRATAQAYAQACTDIGLEFFAEPAGTISNYWLCAIILQDKAQREEFLQYANAQGTMCRPIWTLMNKLKPFEHCQHDGLANSIWCEERVVNIPSGVRHA